MTIQFYPEELDYVNAVLHPSAPKAGSFMTAFCQACVAADSDNYELLRPVVKRIMEKYPADAERLAMERRDRRVE